MTVADSDGLYYFEGSPAAESGAIMSTQPLSSNDPTNIVSSLIHPWLKDCLLLHPACFTTVSAEIIDDRHGSDLPRRILQVRPGPDPSFVKIVHSDGLVSKYCALSHCSGRVERLHGRIVRDSQTSGSLYSSSIPHIYWSNIRAIYYISPQSPGSLANTRALAQAWLGSTGMAYVFQVPS